MMIKKYLFVALIFLLATPVFAKDYKASLFNIKADAKTLNTTSIQFAIDYINSNGGGRLVFEAGQYLTGSIYLKSNVTLHLEEGAVLLGSVNPFNYDRNIWTALIFANDQENIGITGSGTLEGQGKYLAANVVTNIEKGLLKDAYSYGRPAAENRATLLYVRNCKNVLIEGITFANSASWTQIYEQCNTLKIDKIRVDCTTFWNQDGVDIVDCEDVIMSDSYINSADDGICLKSHTASKSCKNILIKNNLIRSSANGIKFGTAGYGGFSDVRIINNTIFNTYRSAIALESVDGGFLHDVVIDSLQSKNTGNVIFIRLGNRVKGKHSTLKNVSISNVVADIPATKADAGYGYEGPEEDQPRNISPAIIISGLPGELISNITLKNIRISHPGGAKIQYANVPLDQLDLIPEIPSKYPDFSMFKELPAWGIFARHATALHLENITLNSETSDFRMPVVLDDVSNSTLINVKALGDENKKIIFQQGTKGVVVKQ
jgi:hypothetical protein